MLLHHRKLPVATVARLVLGTLALCGCADDSKQSLPDMMEGPASGTLLWARSAGGADADQGAALTSASGEALVAGVFGGEATFGQGDKAQTLSASDIQEAFLARYDAGGSLLWARSDGGPGADRAESVVADGDGNAFVTGSFSEAAVFGAGDPEETTLNTVGSRDLFVVRYDTDGNFAWAQSAGSFTGHDGGQGIAIATDGAILVCGHFTNGALFDQGGPGSTTLLGPDLLNVFLASYTANGALSWVVRAAGGEGQDTARAIAAAPGGGAFVVGTFEGMATFGVAPGDQSLVSAGGADVFLARYGPDGALVWAKRAGGADDDEATWVGLSGGEVLLAGSFAETAQFGEKADPKTADSSGGLDVFLASYDLDGGLLWLATAGGPDDDVANGATPADGGGAIVTGSFGGSAVFGQGEAAEASLSSTPGGADAFVVSWSGDGALRWARSAGGNGDDAGFAATVLSDGTIVTTGQFGTQATFGAGEEGEVTLPSSGSSDVFLTGFVP